MLPSAVAAGVRAPSQRSRRLGLLAFLTGLIIWLYVELRYQSQMADKSTAPSAAGTSRMRRVGTGSSGSAGGELGYSEVCRGAKSSAGIPEPDL